MSNIKVGIINYGLGNLRSIENAIIEIEGQPIISEKITNLKGVDCLILPGVGAFSHAMYALKERNLIEFIREVYDSNIPLLGICLGMQLLTEISYEFKETIGLGIIKGKVEKINLKVDIPNKGIRLPNVGWFPLKSTEYQTRISKKVLESVDAKDKFYFVHSYSVNMESPFISSYIKYQGNKISAVISKNNIIGTQFHPEKSGPKGLQILKSFIKYKVV